MFPIQKDFIPRSITLLSVYPIQKRATMRHIGSTSYVLPAADKSKVRIAQPAWACKIFDFQRDLPAVTETDVALGDGYSLLRIYDTYQTITSPTSELPEDRPIMVEFVKDDLLRQWVSQSFGANLGASGPGIIAIAGTTPTADELARARAMQHEFFTALVMEARDLYTTGKAKQINNRHRTAGEYLGIQGEAWIQTIKPKSLKLCGACGKEIETLAITCEHCNANLVKFYEEMSPYGITPEARGDAYLAEVIGKFHESKKPAPPPPAAKPVMAPIAPPPTAAAART